MQDGKSNPAFFMFFLFSFASAARALAGKRGLLMLRRMPSFRQKQGESPSDDPPACVRMDIYPRMTALCFSAAAFWIFSMAFVISASVRV